MASGNPGAVQLDDDEWLIDKVEFANGVFWTPVQLANFFVAGQISQSGDDVYGTNWNDDIFGQDGDDVLRGLSGNDVLNGGAGNDTLIGANGSDIYIYDLGAGDDIIQDYATSGTSENILRFGSGIGPADLLFGTNIYDVSDIVIRFSNASGSITLDNQILGGSSWGVDLVEFEDGTVWESATLLASYLAGQGSAGDDAIGGDNSANTLAGLAGNDFIRSLAGNDTLIGGLGDDRLEGGTGSDVYDYQPGDGLDHILDSGSDASDRLILGSGINPADVLIDPDLSNSGNMFIRFDNLSGQILVEQQWTSNSGLEFIEFADGTVWDYTALQQQFSLGEVRAGSQTINGTSGADTLNGYGGNDTINGAGGNDILIGAADNDYIIGNTGNDTYVFNPGDGSDTFYESESKFNYGGNDTLLFGVGITLDDLILTKPTSDWNDLAIEFIGTTDSILINNQDISYQGRYYNRIEYFTFQALEADGSITQSTVNWAALEARRIGDAATAEADTIVGSTIADTISGASGDDTLYGWSGSDTLIGGAGGDYLLGSSGNDTYVFNLGDGNDIFYESEDKFGNGGNDTLLFGVGITLDDLILTKPTSDWNDLAIEFIGTTDSILINNQDISYQGRYYNRIENFTFQALEADGSITQSTVNWAALEARRIFDAATGAVDTIVGSTIADTINGGDGNDTLYGWSGSDTLIGDVGNDYLVGSTGNDTYVFNLGDGNDIFYESEDKFGNGGNDTLLFGVGITSADIIITQSPSNSKDIIVTFKNSSDSILIDGQGDVYQSRYYNRIENFTFSDGASLSHSDISARKIVVSGAAVTGGVADDQLVGTEVDNSISGNAGDDTLDGLGGNDNLTGGTGDDILYGGSGSDTAVFSGLSQNYVITTGSGNISIADNDAVLDGDDGTDTLVGVEQLLFKDGETVGVSSPIILDLDGDGIETLNAAESNARFDLNGDGVADDTSWIGVGEAFLYLDRDGNGTMSDAGEISFIDDAPNAASDLAGLRAIDSNGDGVLDSSDERFEDFGLWRDADGDGTVDDGETASLSDFGIRSINLEGTAVNGETSLGEVAMVNAGSFTLSDGTTREFADAALTYFPVTSESHSLSESASAYRLPSQERLSLRWQEFPWGAPRSFLREYRMGNENGVKDWKIESTRQPAQDISAIFTAFDGEPAGLYSDSPSDGGGSASFPMATDSTDPSRPGLNWARDTLSEIFNDRQDFSFDDILGRAYKSDTELQIDEPEGSALSGFSDRSVASGLSGATSASLVQKLALIRQDMAVFGGGNATELVGPESRHLHGIVEFHA